MGKNNKKYSQEEAEQIFEEHGLKLMDTYVNGKQNMICYDSNNFKYYKNLRDIITNRIPCKFHRLNPFTIENINHYLAINNISSCKLLSTKYVNTVDKLKWLCSCNNIFYRSIDEITNKKNFWCPTCGKLKGWKDRKPNIKDIRTEFEKRGYVLLSNMYINSQTPLDYICKLHKDKEVQHIRYDSFHNRGDGCMYCGIVSRGIKHRRKESDIKKLVEEKGFIYIKTTYDNKTSKKAQIHYICPNHVDKGEQIIEWSNLQVSNGKCQYCIGRFRTQEDFQRDLFNINPYIEVLKYVSYDINPKLKCLECGNIWDSTKCADLLQGTGCPSCNKSNFEKYCTRILKKWKYKFKTQFKYSDCRDINPLLFDFYLVDFNILIECDGEDHYYPIQRGNDSKEELLMRFNDRIKKDNIKNEYCKKNNIPLIRIPYWEKDDMEYYLFDQLIKLGAIEEIKSD